MVRSYVKIFVCVFVLIVICEGHLDKVFIVYPYKDGDINQSKSTFSIRKFENNFQRRPKMLNDTKVHLVYPTYEDVIIMTSAPPPMPTTQESDDYILETTTMMESYGEHLSDTTTETLDSYTISGDFALGSLNKGEDGTTTATDIDSTTIKLMTTEIPIQIEKSHDQEQSLVDIIYEDRGPVKILRKRMFEATKYPSVLKMNNDMKIPTTMSPKEAFRKWYRKTSRNKFKTVSKKLGTYNKVSI